MKYKAVIVLGVLAGAALLWNKQADDERARNQEQLRRENSVKVLEAIYRERLWWQLQTGANRYIIVRADYVGWKDKFTNSVSFFPRDDLSFSCDAILGITIDAGQSENAPELALVGPLAPDNDLRQMNFGPGVGINSPAVQDIMLELCSSLVTQFGKKPG